MNEIYIETKIVDVDSDKEGKSIKVKIDITDSAIWIGADGHGTSDAPEGEGYPIGVELINGHLRVMIWDDINKGDPKFISMDGALESKYRGEE